LVQLVLLEGDLKMNKENIALPVSTTKTKVVRRKKKNLLTPWLFLLPSIVVLGTFVCMND
jgi:putative chitobiose transport system permease protein